MDVLSTKESALLAWLAGANIAAFLKVGEAVLAQGAV